MGVRDDAVTVVTRRSGPREATVRGARSAAPVRGPRARRGPSTRERDGSKNPAGRRPRRSLMREEVVLFNLPDEGIGGGSCTWHARHVRLLPVDPRVKRLPSSLGSERRGLSLTLYELRPRSTTPTDDVPSEDPRKEVRCREWDLDRGTKRLTRALGVGLRHAEFRWRTSLERRCSSSSPGPGEPRFPSPDEVRPWKRAAPPRAPQRRSGGGTYPLDVQSGVSE